MTPKERRDRLFKSSRPNVRELDFSNAKDMAVLWEAYKRDTFSSMLPDEMEKPEFINAMMQVLSGYNAGWMIEDKTPAFKDEAAPVGIMVAAANDWEMEPHFEPFPWATSRNRLRAVTAFLQKMRYDKDVGIVNVHALNKDKRFFKHIAKNYGVLNYLGRIPHGDARGDRHIFYVRGRKK